MNASTAHADAMIYIARMNITSATEVKYLKGVGPQRAAAFASRGIHSVNDLLLYLPFRYEDRIRFNRIAEIAPGGTYTVHATVGRPLSVRFSRGRGAIFPFIDWRCERDAGLQILSRQLSRRAKSSGAARSFCTAKPSWTRTGPAGSR